MKVSEASVKHVRDEPRSKRDQLNSSYAVQLPLFSDFMCHFLTCARFSVIVPCRLWVNGVYMSMNVVSLFVLSASLMSGRLLLLLLVMEHSSL